MWYCDGCGIKKLNQWYRCINCADVDLCLRCYEGKIPIEGHTDDHLMVLLERTCADCEGFIIGSCFFENTWGQSICLGCYITNYYRPRDLGLDARSWLQNVLARQSQKWSMSSREFQTWQYRGTELQLGAPYIFQERDGRNRFITKSYSELIDRLQTPFGLLNNLITKGVITFREKNRITGTAGGVRDPHEQSEALVEIMRRADNSIYQKFIEVLASFQMDLVIKLTTEKPEDITRHLFRLEGSSTHYAGDSMDDMPSRLSNYVEYGESKRNRMIQHFNIDLIERLQIEHGLLDELVSRQVITFREKIAIAGLGPGRKNPYEQNEMLIEILRKADRSKYLRFLEALALRQIDLVKPLVGIPASEVVKGAFPGRTSSFIGEDNEPSRAPSRRQRTNEEIDLTSAQTDSSSVTPRKLSHYHMSGEDRVPYQVGRYHSVMVQNANCKVEALTVEYTEEPYHDTVHPGQKWRGNHNTQPEVSAPDRYRPQRQVPSGDTFSYPMTSQSVSWASDWPDSEEVYSRDVTIRRSPFGPQQEMVIDHQRRRSDGNTFRHEMMSDRLPTSPQASDFSGSITRSQTSDPRQFMMLDHQRQRSDDTFRHEMRSKTFSTTGQASGLSSKLHSQSRLSIGYEEKMASESYRSRSQGATLNPQMLLETFPERPQASGFSGNVTCSLASDPQQDMIYTHQGHRPSEDIVPHADSFRRNRNWMEWSCADVVDYLKDNNFSQYAGLFEQEDIDGSALCYLTDETLREMGVASALHRTKILAKFKKLRSSVPE